MKTMTKYILALTAVLLIGIACERKTETLGPNLSDLYGDFQVFEDFDVSSKEADFTSENINFSARFSKSVDWEIHIIGQTSGATKVLTGKSKIIDQTNSVWNGSTTLLPMFKTETCNAILSIPEEGFGDTILGINIDSTKVNDGFIIADFEDGINPGWDIFIQSGGDMKFIIENSDSSAEAFHYYNMGGEVNFDWLIGYIYFPASAYGETHYPLNPNPDNVYYNVFLDKPAGITNEVVLFQFLEDENGDGVHDGSSEDMYSLELRGLEANWQHISIKYADLISLANGQPAPPAGNGVHEPDKLLEVRTLFLANPSSGYSQTMMDYVMFTENQPLQP